MKKTKRFLSLLTSTAIAASAFSALVIPASAEETITATLVHTASAQGGSNPVATYLDEAEHYVNNWGTASWAATGYTEFTIDGEELNAENAASISNVTLTFMTKCGGNNDNRALDVALLDSATTEGIDFATEINMINKPANIVGSVSPVTRTYQTFSLDVTSAVRDSIAEGNTRFIFAYANAAAGGYIKGLAAEESEKPALTITLTDSAMYDVTINNKVGDITLATYEVKGVFDGETVEATSQMLGYKEYEGVKYVPKADAQTSIDVSEGNTVLDIEFEKLDDSIVEYEDFENITGDWGFTSEDKSVPAVTDGAMMITTFNNASSKVVADDTKVFDENVSSVAKGNISFSYMSGVEALKNRTSAFALKDSDDNVIIQLFGTGAATEGLSAGVTYTVGEALYDKATGYTGKGTLIDGSSTNKWYNVSIDFDFTGETNKVSGSISNDSGVLVTIPETEVAASNIGKMVGTIIYSAAPQYIDNVVVTAEETEEPTTDPTAAPTADPTTEPTDEPSGEMPAVGEELINEDFASTTGTWGFEGSGGANIENGYLVVNTNNKNGALATKTLDEAIKDADSLSIKFDWASNVETGKDRSSAFELCDSNNTLIFAMYGKGGTKADSGIKYGLVDGTWIDIESHTTGKWYTVELDVNFAAKTMSVSVKDTSAGKELVNLPSVDITAENLAFMIGNDIYSLAPQWVDNVLVKTPDTYALNVTVKDADGAPVEGAAVEAVGSGKSAVTDAEGKAMLVLQNGNYKIKASKPGYYIAEQDTTVDGTSSCEVTLAYAGDPVATSITISGGDEYIYQPKAGGQNKTVTPYTAVVYDQTGQVMTDAEVSWIVKSEPTGASIDASGIVTIDPTFNVTDINGQDITIAASSGDATAETTLHVRQDQNLSSFVVSGANVIKYGKTAEYSVVDEKDQYGEAYGYDDVTYTLAATNATTDGMNVTATDAGTQLSEIKVTITSSNDVKAEKTVTGYGYDFYEPGVGETAYAENASMITLGDESVLAWPTTPGTGYIVFPDPVELTPGSAKLIKFKLAETTQTLVAQERTLDFQNAEGVSAFADGKLWNASGKLGFSPVYEDKMYQWLEGSKPVGDIGSAGLSTWVDCQILIKTANDGVSSVIVDVGGDKVETTITADDGTGARVDEISKIELVTGTGVPDVRNLAIKDIVISDSDVAEVEIAGDDHIAKAEGKVATKSYRGAVYTSIDGETFTWSVSGEGTEGGAGIETTKAEFNLYKAAEEDITAVAIFPVYENGVLKSLTTEQVAIGKGDTAVTIDADADDIVFLWNSFEKAEPLAPKATIKTVTSDTDAAVTIDQNGVLSVKDTAKAGSVVTIRYTSSASTDDSPRYAEKQVTINDFANVDSFEIDGPAAVNAGDTVTYEAVNIKDEYGDTVDLNTVYAVTAGADIASIDPVTGVLTTSKDKTGDITVAVTVGNTGKTKTIEKAVYVGAYSVSGTPDGNSVEVDVTNIANYSANTEYLVTTAKDGVILAQTETKATGGKVVVDTTGADAYEVSPIYFYDNVGNVSAGKEIALADGYYDFTFRKANGTRADIYVNGYMVGQNVDQYGAGRSTSGSYYTVKDVKVSGGSAVVTMKDNTSEMTSIEVKKSPSIVDRKTHVYILGDSLVANYYDTFKDEDGDGIPAAGDAQTGWGQVFNKYVTDEMNVTNLAESGNYAKGLYDSVFHSVIFNSEPGDYLLFECGYNDKNYSSAVEMQETVKLVQQECDEKGITVIFVTPNASVHDWKAGVSLTGSLIEVCNEIGAKCIDLSGLSYAYYSTTKATNEDSNAYALKNFNVYFDGASQDTLHSSYLGAMKCAEIVAQGIYDMQKTDDTLAGLKINTEAKYDLTDSEGGTITMQVK